MKTIEFPLENFQQFKGKIQITFNDIFLFDNVFYFTINIPKKTSILNIGKTSSYLSKIFTDEDFHFTNSTLQNVNYNLIPSQQLLILNQLKNIPIILGKKILDFVENGGHLLIIPCLLYTSDAADE